MGSWWSQKAKNNSGDGHSWDTKTEECLLCQEQSRWLSGQALVIDNEKCWNEGFSASSSEKSRRRPWAKKVLFMPHICIIKAFYPFLDLPPVWFRGNKTESSYLEESTVASNSKVAGHNMSSCSWFFLLPFFSSFLSLDWGPVTKHLQGLRRSVNLWILMQGRLKNIMRSLHGSLYMQLPPFEKSRLSGGKEEASAPISIFVFLSLNEQCSIFVLLWSYLDKRS